MKPLEFSRSCPEFPRSFAGFPRRAWVCFHANNILHNQLLYIAYTKGRSRVSSKSSRTQSEAMSHKKNLVKTSFLFQGKYDELHLFIVCLFFLKYAHKKSCSLASAARLNALGKSIANSTRCAVSSFSNHVGLEFFETVFETETYVFSIVFGTEASLL